MFLTAYDPLEPSDLKRIKCVLEVIRIDRGLENGDPEVEKIAHELVNLWLAGFREPDEMTAMMTPITHD